MKAVENRRMTMIAIAILAGLSFLVVLQKKTTDKALNLETDSAPNTVVPIYQYGESQTIYIGTQPLYAPTGLITEALRRDPVLKEELLKLGLKIKFYPFKKGADVNTELSRGGLQSGIGGDMPALMAAATTDIVIPVMVQSGSTWLVTKTPVLVEHLKGKRIAYAKGSNAHFMLLSLLSSYHLSANDFDLVPMNVDDMIEALESQTISAFAAWEPTPTIALQKHRFVARFGGPSSGYMYFRKDFADKQPAALRHIVAAVARAFLWLSNGNDASRIKASGWSIEAAEILTGAKLNLSPEALALLGERDILRAKWARSFVIPAHDLADNGRLKREYSFLKEMGSIHGETTWEAVRDSFDLTILSDIFANTGAYRLSEFRYSAQPLGSDNPSSMRGQEREHNELK
jgi:ABC-type nitrate/sulfonate/bicarbonate transport system substrate-binding protein